MDIYNGLSLKFPVVDKLPISNFLSHEVIPDKYYYKHTDKIWPLLSEQVTKNNVVYQCRRTYIRENKSGECPTLTANMGGGGHNIPIILDARGIRRLTPRECFNLQGFPRSYILPNNIADVHLYKLAGNAVCVANVKLIAERLLPLINMAKNL